MTPEEAGHYDFEVVIGLLMVLQFHDCLEMLTKTLKLLRVFKETY